MSARGVPREHQSTTGFQCTTDGSGITSWTVFDACASGDWAHVIMGGQDRLKGTLKINREICGWGLPIGCPDRAGPRPDAVVR